MNETMPATGSKSFGAGAVLTLVFSLFLITTAGLQWARGAYRAEFGGDADEATHYVTSLMVRDYLAALMPGPPMQFAKNYYLHYPKVGLGHWPPFFYIVHASWTLLFSPSRFSALCLMALLTALLALTLYLVVRDEFSNRAGIAAGLMFISLPLVQRFAGMIMAEMLVALLVFAAVLVFARYLDTERWQDAALFGLLASAAILTKATGLVLAFVPLMSLLLSRRLYLLVRSSLWLPALIVLALCGPWYLLAPDANHESVALAGGISLWGSEELPVLAILPRLAGWGVLLVILAGFLVRVVWPLLKREKIPSRWACAGALVVSFLLFRYLVAEATPFKHLTIVAAPFLMFLAAGLDLLAPRFPPQRVSERRKALALAVLTGLVYLYEAFTIPRKRAHGFSQVADYLVSKPQLRDSVFLISSNASGEGSFIAEVAMRERRPGHFVLRASKVLSHSDWDGNRYKLMHRTRAMIENYLASVPVGVVVIDWSPQRRLPEHERLLMETVKANPDRWQLLTSYQDRLAPDPGATILVYGQAGHETKPPGEIRIDMSRTLGTVLRFRPQDAKSK